MGYLGLYRLVALNCKMPASSECPGKRNGSSLFGFVLINRFVVTACTPMNIDPSRKDIEDWNKCVEDQAHLGPNEGQRDRNEVNQRCHERSFHPAADQVGMNVRIDMTSFGRGIPPMKSQRQTNRDEVAP